MPLDSLRLPEFFSMIQLSEHFDFKKLIRFTLPSVVMLLFTSIYGVVDGFFVSNFVGLPAFTAVNFIMPFLMILGCVGFLFGTGGSALVAKIMGEGDIDRANRVFSFLVYFSAACGILLSVLGLIFIRPIAYMMGARDDLLENSVIYARVILLAIPAFILQYEFQCLFSTAEKPKLGLFITIAAGVANIVLDAVFVAGFSWGIIGAAAATALSQCIGGILPLIYFARKNAGRLRLTRTRFEGRALLKTVANGASELLSNVSMSLSSMFYNVQLLRYAGENGVAAYGILMYVNLLFQAIFIGFSVGVAPVVSYHLGAKSYPELKSLLKKSLIVISVSAILMFALAQLLALPVALVFASYNAELLALTRRAFLFFSFTFLFSGFSIFASSFFTALNSGLFSALLSVMRMLVFQISAVFLLPLIFGLDGIWLALAAADGLAFLLADTLLFFNRKRFHYWE